MRKLTFIASASAPSLASTVGWFLTVTWGGPFNASINETAEYPGGILSPWLLKINLFRGLNVNFYYVRPVVELYSTHLQHFFELHVFATMLGKELGKLDNY